MTQREAPTDHLLGLVKEALDQFETDTPSAVARRTARIASLLGETELAVRLGFELKPVGGHPSSNAEDTRRLMTDPSTWSDPDGPAERALAGYIEDRRIESGEKEGLISGHSLSEIQHLLSLEAPDLRDNPDWQLQTHDLRSFQDRVRHRCFVALCSWERQLTYANTNELIFQRFRDTVDAELSNGAPDILNQFTVVHRRLREAAASGDPDASEELSQAVTTCRRILKAIADHLLPGSPGGMSEDGHDLNESAYRNRVHEFVKQQSGSDTRATTIAAEIDGLIKRYNAIDSLSSKGVHARIALEEAEICAITTYIVVGELLRLQNKSTSAT